MKYLCGSLTFKNPHNGTMRKTALVLIGICGLVVAACKQGANTAPNEENLYETLTVSLSDRTLTTGYSATITKEVQPLMLFLFGRTAVFAQLWICSFQNKAFA